MIDRSDTRRAHRPRLAIWSAATILAALVGAPASVRAAPPPAPRTLELWPPGTLAAAGEADDRPAVTAYLPAPGTGTGAAILVVPGGGFTRRCADHEGVLVAEWLRGRGVAAFLLTYRVVPLGTVKDALQDVHRGLQYLRSHAAEWGVSPGRVGAIGFSAGATLVANTALRPRPGAAANRDPVERVSSRPDFLVLAYGDAHQSNPGVRGLAALGLTAEEAVQIFAPTADEIAAAPPSFLFCTAEDGRQVRGMADLYSRLVTAGRPAEAHFFGFGEHGVGFAGGDPILGRWPELLHSWMSTSGFLTEQKRVAVRGRIQVDGAPLPRGSVILTPLEGIGAPSVIGYVFGTEEPPGEFAVRAERGPTPGRYRVEVRQDALRWASNSRDPVLRRLQGKVRDGGALSAEDRAEWVAWAKTRDYSPSIEDQRVYRRKGPGAEDMVVNIEAGRENRLDLQIQTR